MKQLYQHRISQRELDHDVVPDKKKPTKCKTCGLTIIKVDNDEGPETLKAMFRF